MDSDKIIESLTEIRTQMRWMTQDVSGTMLGTQSGQYFSTMSIHRVGA
jgi:hypothetical protein